MKISIRVLTFLVLLVFVHTTAMSETVGVFFDSSVPQIKFAAQDVKVALEARSFTVELLPLTSLNAAYANKKVVVALVNNTGVTDVLKAQSGTIPTGLGEQAYGLRTTISPQQSYWALGGDVNGAMYGALQIGENIKFFGVSQIYNLQESPKILKRGIKLNMPFDAVAPTYETNSGGTSYQNAIPHVWDITFWEEWFDEMARNRYNFVSVWNNHPFTSLIKLTDYPNVAINNVTGFNGYTKTMTMDQKIAHWRQVMILAHNRGFEFMFFNWNVWVSNANGQYGLSNGVVSPANTAYTAKCMTKLLETYPDLDGFGLTNGENNSTEEFLWGAFGKPVYDYFKANPTKKFSLIHRWHQASMTEIKTTFAPLFTLSNVKLDMSFKYSKAHMYSVPVPGHFDSKEADVIANNMKCWFTVRNDDFYYNSWGDPIFARAYLKGMTDRSYFAGFYIGSDGYCPTRTFLSKNTAYQGKLEVQRQWYTNMVWGRLAYNPTISDDVFKNQMNHKFPSVSSADLFTAWSKASSGVQKTNELIHEDFDLDFKWYPEACQNSANGFVTVDLFAKAIVGPGSNLCSISLTAANNCGTKKTALQLADEIEANALSALDLVSPMIADANSELGVTINNIKAFAYLSMYYVCKIRGGVYKLSNQAVKKTDALGQGYCWWIKYSKTMFAMYNGQDNQRTNDIRPDWKFRDAQVLSEYNANGGVGTPNCAVSQLNIVVLANNPVGGSVTGGGQFNSGTTVTVTAKSKLGFRFSEWKENGVRVSTDSIYSFVASQDRSLEAFFRDKASCDVPWSSADLTISFTTITNQSLGVVNTSCTPNVIISADIEGLGGLDLSDYCQLSYKINGGSLVKLFDINNLAGAFAKKSFSNTVSANSVELVLNSKNTANDEIYKISNIKIMSSPTSITTVKPYNSEQNGIHIYPNPASNVLNIEFSDSQTNRNIKIFNAVGQLVYRLQTKETLAKIYVKSLKLSGIMTVQVDDGKSVSNYKVILN